MTMPVSDVNYQGYTLPLVINPPDSLCFTVKVPNDQFHIAAFLGTLFELTQWITWARDPLKRGKDAAAVWRDIWTDLEAQSCNLPSAPRGAEIEDFMPLRVDCDCNVFITCCDGTEKQLLTSDQVKALIQGAATQGAPQPAPGKCQDYKVALIAGQYQIIPTVVNSGDTIELVSASGATTEDGVVWYCPDGEIYFAGSCAGGGVFSGSNPLPAAKTGRVILFLNSVYYDLPTPGTFTVPGGIVNQTPSILVNFNPASAIHSGTLQCDVNVCNNATVTWSSHFDFTTSPYTSIWSAITGSWAAGLGWFSAGAGIPAQIQCTIAPVDIERLNQVYDCGSLGGGSQVVNFETNFGVYGVNGTPVVGTGEVWDQIVHQPGVTNIYPAVNPGTAGANVYIKQLTVYGQGSKPAGWP